MPWHCHMDKYKQPSCRWMGQRICEFRPRIPVPTWNPGCSDGHSVDLIKKSKGSSTALSTEHTLSLLTVYLIWIGVWRTRSDSPNCPSLPVDKYRTAVELKPARQQNTKIRRPGKPGRQEASESPAPPVGCASRSISNMSQGVASYVLHACLHLTP
ncbi:hypothetical protein VTN96DRAFT_9665 [Rasamsonia emersonii]